MYKCVVRFISSSTMKFKYFFWCSKIHISDYLQFLPVDKFFLLVLNETNEHDIIFFLHGFLVFIFIEKEPMLWHLVWILMSQDSCILIPMYIYCMKKITLFLFWYLKNKKKNETKVPDNINLNNIYTSSCFAESSHDVFTNLSQDSILFYSIKCMFWCKFIAEGTLCEKYSNRCGQQCCLWQGSRQLVWGSVN